MSLCGGPVWDALDIDKRIIVNQKFILFKSLNWVRLLVHVCRVYLSESVDSLFEKECIMVGGVGG